MKKAIVAFKFLAVLVILISIPLLHRGISGMVRSYRASENYLSTEAVVSGYREVQGKGSERHRTRYCLTYAYVVEGEMYYIDDELLVSTLPPAGYSRQVLYHPADPEDALFAGKSGSSAALMAGLMFLLIPLVMLFGWLIVTDRLPVKAENVFDIAVGLVMAVLGIGTIYGMTGTFSVIRAFRQFHFIALIPAAMIAAGVWQTVRSIFFVKK